MSGAPNETGPMPVSRLPEVVDVRVLGPLEVVDGAGVPIDLPGLRPKALLAFLTLQPARTASTDRILDTVWADAPPASMATTVQMTVSRVRKAIGERQITTTADGYRLELPDPNTDLSRFRLHTRRGRQLQTMGSHVAACEAFRQALAEWRGAPLADLRQLDFAERAAQLIEDERLGVVEDLMDATLAAGDHQLVVGELSGMVEAFPYRERLWYQLMVALYRSGRQAEALATFNQAKEALAESLGIEPSPELADLEERILLHDPSLDQFVRVPDHDERDVVRLDFPAGAVIVEEGEPADTVYWIESGRVEISSTSANGSSSVLAELGPGRYFGELAALLRTQRTATARALVPTTLTVHDAASFRARLGAEQTRAVAAGTPEDIQRLLGSGQYLDAYDAATSLIEAGEQSQEVKYSAVLALARAGATASARRQHEILGLDRIDPTSVEPRLAEDLAVLGARLDKDQALRATGDRRRAWASRSASGYEAAYGASGAPFHAVNAATLWLVAGDDARAAEIAATITIPDVDRLEGLEQYWASASAAEAALVVGDIDRAAEAIDVAAGLADSAARATTTRNLELLCDLQGIDRGILDRLRNKPVVHYCGHVIQPDGQPGRFPVTEQGRVAAELRETFSALGAGVGFGSLAAGADILAAEVLLDLGAQLNVVLPFDAAEFVEVSVAPAGHEWRGRFERCLDAAASVDVATSGEYLGDPVLFDFCARIAMGDALIRASHLVTDAHQVAVWDGTPSSGVAGTAIDVTHWSATGRSSTVIPVTPGPVSDSGEPSGSRRSIRSIVFADFAGFSRLTDAKVLRFQEDVMETVSHAIEPFRPEILSGRTWGDGIYLVLDDVASAASCALALQEVAQGLDFNELGMPEVRGLRVAAHATPIFDGWDPISGGRLFFGAGVTQTARIEPRTPEGEIYTTRAFAALAVLAGAQEFECQYVGTMPTAKDYGSLPLYSLRRKLLVG